MSNGMIDLKTSIFEHEVLGKLVKFAILDSANDSYRENIRNYPPHEEFMAYFLARSKRVGRPLKVVDGGANIGTIALPLAALGFSVLAIEILPENIAALFRAIIENKFANIIVAPVALYEKAASIGIHGFSAWGGVDLSGTSSNRCYADKLSNLMLAYGFADADIVKLDIEGAELAALKGIEVITASNNKIEFIFESNSHTCSIFGYKCQDLIEHFENIAFTCYYIRGQSLAICSSNNVQPRIIEDILATRSSPEELFNELGYKIIKESEDSILNQFEQQAYVDDSIHHHQHVARQIQLLSQEECQKPRVAKLIEHLKTFEDAIVTNEINQPPGSFTI